ncbi:putative type IX sorting system protein PorV2 [Adhaeribacter soli]|uniref:PorV/PorQ family protein n=1 Tax=Adhaeribacter soli TaxID=2607655 RepID=A0A5N1IX46_9BACT|nr:PorV/PorQ family protein [Adhaeribacter soli]KAA9332642.1 PorV/PorQ family protein [Adhaeribacter soli]
MSKKLSKWLVAAFALVSSSAAAQVSAPKYSNEFLNIGVGGRALGMGNVQSAIVSDATAGFWNPAGLTKLENKYNLVGMHSELFAGIIKNDYLTFATPLDTASALAISVIRVGVDDIADTRRLISNNVISYDSIQFFSVADYALLVSYARKSNLIRGLRLGGNAKIIYRHIGDFANSWGFGFDAGAQLERNRWKFGLMAKDITTTFNAWSINTEELRDTYNATGNELPKNSVEVTLPRLVLGVGRDFKIGSKFTALVATDLDLTFDGKRNVLVKTGLVSLDPHIGAEIGYGGIVFLRGGLNNLQQFEKLEGGESWKAQPNFGVGVAMKGLTLDLALSKVADNSSVSSVIVSLGYSFDK